MKKYNITAVRTTNEAETKHRITLAFDVLFNKKSSDPLVLCLLRAAKRGRELKAQETKSNPKENG